MKEMKRKDFFVWIVLLIAWLSMSIVPLLIPKTSGLLADYHDLVVYFMRGNWIMDNSPMVSEYPPVPTLLFGANRLLVSMFDALPQKEFFVAIFSLEMMLVLFLVYKVMTRLISNSLFVIAIILLPPVIYFTYSRFDILPTFFSLLAYCYVTNRRWGWAGFWLGVATFTKWYPVLLFPGYFLYVICQEKDRKAAWQMLYVFLGTGALIVLLTYIQGGWTAIVSPYVFHLNRGMEYIAFPKLIYTGASHLVQNLKMYYVVFFILQVFMPVFLVTFSKIDTRERLAYYSIAVLSMFIVFARIWSPQWFLWLIPFLVALIKDWRSVLGIAMFSSIVFIGFPVLFDVYGADSLYLVVAGVAYYAILAGFVVRALSKMKISLSPVLLGCLRATSN